MLDIFENGKMMKSEFFALAIEIAHMMIRYSPRAW